MDLNQNVWDDLRANGHIVGDPYIHEDGGLFIVVDGVAMTVMDATAVAQKRATVAQIAHARNS